MKKMSLLVTLALALATARFAEAQTQDVSDGTNFVNAIDDLLSRKGLTLQLSETSDASFNLRGQEESTRPPIRQLMKLSVLLQSKQLGWQNGRFFAIAHSHSGRDGASYLDTTQGVSNIDATNRTHLYELWFEQYLFRKVVRIKTGKVDANTEFAFVENAADFINPSMGFSPTIVGFPTFPDGHLSFNVFAYPGKSTYAGFGLYALAGEGKFLITEAGQRWRSGNDAREGRFAGGMWLNTASFERFDGKTQAATRGFYFVTDQALTKAIRSYAQFGYADRKLSKAVHHVGAGLTWTGALPKRHKDIVGVGATMVRVAGSPDTVHTSEFTVETFYKISIRPWLQFAPDLQYVRHANGIPVRPNALLGTVRFTITPNAGYKDPDGE